MNTCALISNKLGLCGHENIFGATLIFMFRLFRGHNVYQIMLLNMVNVC